MELAKTFFGISSNRTGYSSKRINPETLFDDNDEEEGGEEEKENTKKLNNPLTLTPVVKTTKQVNTNGELISFTPHPPLSGQPFSALTLSMKPEMHVYKKKEKLNKNEEKQEEEEEEEDEEEEEKDEEEEDDEKYDEFGFLLKNDGENKKRIKFVEDPQHRLKWIGYLEFAHNKTCSQLTWENLDVRLSTSERLKLMLRQGVPHSLRGQIWIRTSGALEKKIQQEINYKTIIKASTNNHLLTSKQIEKDLLRTFPTNFCFSTPFSTGIPRLRRSLRALAWLFPDIGYCQGTGLILASLLLVMEEEEAFDMMCCIVDDILPPSYFSNTLLGVHADQRVLRSLIITHLPSIHSHFVAHQIELSMITLNWFLTLFSSCLSFPTLLRVWDILFYQGSIVLFLVAMAMIKIKEKDILACKNELELINFLTSIPFSINDPDLLIETAYKHFSLITEVNIEGNRKKEEAILMADLGLPINPHSVKNLPKQHLTKRKLTRSKSLMSILKPSSPNFLFHHPHNNQGSFGNYSNLFELEKTKNIRQTEILVDLRNAIFQVARHFHSLDPNNKNISLEVDYDMNSHSQDLENFIKVIRSKVKRGKALLDFEKHEEDELGFKKNDVITIISQKDDHCWIGELNGNRGWFPAKFVELLDERSKNYSSAGDDSVSDQITDLVRGLLCPALKRVFEHGLRRPSLLTPSLHPWVFIQEAASKEVEKDFQSVYSRLILCKTFKLDEDGKVLTPEELLYRSIQAVNNSHDLAGVGSDVKFRSLVCLALNEQVLHLWLECLCCCMEVVEKWFHPWAFLRSPAWVQIKCELRLLSQFSFNLSLDWEFPRHDFKIFDKIKNNVKQELTKYHLFSWEMEE